jgi:hypothetical protein
VSTNTHAAIGVLLDVSFSMQSILHQRKVKDYFFSEPFVYAIGRGGGVTIFCPVYPTHSLLCCICLYVVGCNAMPVISAILCNMLVKANIFILDIL